MKEVYYNYCKKNFPGFKIKCGNFSVEAERHNIRISVVLVGKGYPKCEIYDRDLRTKLFEGPIRTVSDLKTIYDLRKIKEHINEKN